MSLLAAGSEHAIPAVKCLQVCALNHTTAEIVYVQHIDKELADYYSFRLFMVYLMTLSVAVYCSDPEWGILGSVPLLHTCIVCVVHAGLPLGPSPTVIGLGTGSGVRLTDT